MANFSMVMSGSASITYLLDTHGPHALHVLAVVNFTKNMVLYGFTFFVNGMVESRGVKTSLLILAGCQAFCWLASIPMYVFGKRARSFVSSTHFQGKAYSNSSSDCQAPKPLHSWRRWCSFSLTWYNSSQRNVCAVR